MCFTGPQVRPLVYLASDSGTPRAGATMPLPNLPLQMRKFTYLQAGSSMDQKNICMSR